MRLLSACEYMIYTYYTTIASDTALSKIPHTYRPNA